MRIIAVIQSKEQTYMCIYVCGDIHSTLDINKLDQFIGREDLNEDDYIIICGDTGICGFSREQEDADVESFHCRIDEVTQI